MTFFLQLFTQGIVIGLVYALIGQGLNVTFWTIKVVNFAHGSLMMSAVFASLSLGALGIPAWMSFFLALAVVGTIGVLIELVAVRPVVKKPGGLGWMVATIGAAIVLQEIATAIYGPQARAAPAVLFD